MFVEVTAVTLLSLLLFKPFLFKHHNSLLQSFYFSASRDILEEAEPWASSVVIRFTCKSSPTSLVSELELMKALTN